MKRALLILARIGGYIGVGMVALVVVVVSAIVGVTQTQWGLGTGSTLLSNTLNEQLNGHFEVSFERAAIGFGGFEGVSVRVRTHQGGPMVLSAEGLKVDWRALKVLRSVSEPTLDIELPHVRLERAHVDLTDVDAFVRAFSVRGAAPEASDAGQPPPVALRITQAIVDEVSADVPGPDTPISVLAQAVEGSVLVDSDVVIDASLPRAVAKARLSEAAREMDASGAATAGLSIDAKGELVLVATYSGTVGDAFAHVNAALVGDDWLAAVKLLAEPDAVAALDLGFQPGAPLDVSVDILGDMTKASTLINVKADRSELGASADVTFEPLTLMAIVKGEHIDPSELYAGADSGRADLDARFEYTPKELGVQLNLASGRYGRMAIPPAKVVLSAQRLEDYQLDVVLLDESGAHLRADLALRERVSVRAVLESRALPKVASNELDDRVVLDDAHVVVDAIADPTFALQSARGSATVRRLSIPAASLRVSELEATLSLDDVRRAERLKGNLNAANVKFGQTQVSDLTLEVEPLALQHRLRGRGNVRIFTNAPVHRLTLDIGVHGLQPVDLRAVRATLGTKGERIALRADSVLQTNTGWQVEHAVLSGAGQLTINALVGPKVKASIGVEELDLAAVSRIFSPLVPDFKGTISGQSEILFADALPIRGFVDLRGRGLAFGRLEKIQADVHVRSDGTLVNGDVAVVHGATRASVGLRDVVQTTVEAMMAKPKTTTLSELQGQVLASAASTGPELALLFAQPNLNQELSVQTELEFVNQVREPLRIESRTTAVLRPGQPDAAAAKTVPREVRFDWTSHFDQASAAWRNEVELSATDISTLDGEATLRVALAGVPLSELGTALLEASVEGELHLAKVDLSLLPRDLPLPGLEGTLEAEGQLRGTLGSPQGDLKLIATDLQVQSIEQSLAVTVRANAEYVRNAMRVDLALTHDGAKVASGLVDGNWATNQWLLSTRLDDISLGCFPYVRDFGIEGHLTGYAEVELGDQLKMSTYLLGRGFRINAAELPYWSLQADVGAGKGNAIATFIEPDGFARITVEAPNMGASLANVGPLKLTAAMKNFELRPVLGLTRGAVQDGAGIVNGNLEAEFVDQNIEATGSLVLRNGSLMIPALGREFTALQATLRAEPGKLSVDEFKGRFGPGRFEGDGRLAYDQHANLSADLDVHIPSGAPIPLSHEGRDVARMSGRVAVTAKSNSSGVTTELTLSQIDVFVSEETQQVLPLESPSYTTIGYQSLDGAFTAYGSEEAKPGTRNEVEEPMTLKVRLGRDVWVHRGQGTFAALEGGIVLRLDNEVRSEGALTIPEGRIDVMGRVFEVRPSTVTFGGDDMDPDVVAEAVWLSPSGHAVIASFRGPVSSGKMQLRSEPALSYGEILNVLLFDDPTGAPDSGASPTATSVAGTLVGAGLGRTLSDLTNLDLQASVETTESGSTRPEVGIRISPRLALQVSYNPEPVVSLTEPPDQARVSLDWRISKGWSLESKLGNQGSASADLSWQYRY